MEEGWLRRRQVANDERQNVISYYKIVTFLIYKMTIVQKETLK